MMIRSLLLGAAAVLCTAGAAMADPPGRGRGQGLPDWGQNWSPDQAFDAAQQGRHVPFRDILSNIQARYPGRLLQSRLVGGSPSFYIIDWLTPDGRKLVITANAETGAIMSVSGG